MAPENSTIPVVKKVTHRKVHKGTKKACGNKAPPQKIQNKFWAFAKYALVCIGGAAFGYGARAYTENGDSGTQTT
jgi:hypothetical protein